MKLTIAYITSRHQPEFSWFEESLANEIRGGDDLVILLITLFDCARHIDVERSKRLFNGESVKAMWCGIKPSYWQGKHRLTKEDWWAVANARNTALCRCETDWIAFLDDRCVLMPGWLDAVRATMAGNYIVAGAYEKRTAMTVENGVIKNAGIVTGEDSREEYVRKQKFETPWLCPGQWLFGCNLAMPLEWALQVNGYSETLTDSLSFEDVPFGLVLANNGFPIKYDPTMKIVEDRTPELCGPVMRRTDKGVSPNDKSHKVLEIVRDLRESPNPFNLRKLREHVQAGSSFPPPSGPTTDWWDGQPIVDFK